MSDLQTPSSPVPLAVEDYASVQSEIPNGATLRYNTDVGSWGHDPLPSRAQAVDAISQLGPVLYAASAGEWIKIGWTTNLTNRLRCLSYYIQQFGQRGVELLAFRFGSRQDETAVHASLARHRVHGREYYRRTDEVLALVNQWRDQLGQDHLA